jgi:hypothetical protein
MFLSYKTNPMAKYSRKSQSKVKRAMHEMKEGKLKSGRSGKKVKNPRQAIAIGLSEAREEGAKVPAKKGARKKSAKKSTGRKKAAKKSTGRKKAAKKSAPRKSSSTRKKAGRPAKKRGRPAKKSSSSKKAAPKKKGRKRKS